MVHQNEQPPDSYITMPLHRDRSRSPAYSDRDLPEGVSAISESDYFLKNTEFTIWLKDERGKVCRTTTSLVKIQQGR